MALEIPPYSGYRTQAMRHGRSSSQGDGQKTSKRTRLSKAKSDRLLYTSPKGYKQNPGRYNELCAYADRLNGRRTVNVSEG
jgi:hypothetical protein